MIFVVVDAAIAFGLAHDRHDVGRGHPAGIDQAGQTGGVAGAAAGNADDVDVVHGLGMPWCGGSTVGECKPHATERFPLSPFQPQGVADPSILHVNPAIPKDSAVLIHRDEGTVLDAERLHDMYPIVC